MSVGAVTLELDRIFVSGHAALVGLRLTRACAAAAGPKTHFDQTPH